MKDVLHIETSGADTWYATDTQGKLAVVSAADLLTGIYEPELLAARAEQMLQPGDKLLERMTAVATVLVQPDQQIGMIDAILGDSTALETVQERSYRIVNTDADGHDQASFDALVLAESGGIQIRRHVFPSEVRLMIQKHEHASHAVTIHDLGPIPFTDDVFEEDPAGDPFTVYSSRYKGEFVGKEQDVEVGEVRLLRTQQRAIGINQTNIMSDTFIHASTTQPRSGFLSTVVVAVKGEKPAAHVFKQPGESSPPRLEKIDVEGNLRRVRRVLTGSRLV